MAQAKRNRRLGITAGARRSRAQIMRRGGGALAGLALLLGLVAGCGGSESAESKRQHCQSLSHAEHATCVAELRKEEGRTPPAPEPVAETKVEEPGGPLEEVGTITISDGEGTTFRDRYSIGPLLTGDEYPAPSAVLENCNILGGTAAVHSAFARGEISVSYTEGSFPEQIAIDPETTIADEGEDLYASVIAYKADGEWYCRQEGLPQWEIQPGETKHFPFWFVVGDILNNARPEVPAELFNGWYFRFLGPLPALQGTAKTTGPGAASCKSYGGPEPRLYLYNRSGRCEGS